MIGAYTKCMAIYERMTTGMMQELPTIISERRAWAVVDVAAIEGNTRQLCHLIGAAQVIGVVKADGYGHGAVEGARAMVRGGAAMLAVATVGEGRRLRQAGIAAPLLVLGPANLDQLTEALALDLTLSVGDVATMRALAAAAQSSGRIARAHLEIDTGMHRLGFLPHEVLPLMAHEPSASMLCWEGVFTHFACADEPARPETAAQIATFEGVLAGLDNLGVRFPMIHAANSAGALAFPRAHYDAVRAGIALYGVAPGPDVALPACFQPALSFHTHILRLADLPTGSPVSYGGSYRTPGLRRIATIAAGYADGLRRSPAWREVLINGCRAPIVGRICMDYAMVDVTRVAATVGDEVVLLGPQGDTRISAEEVATWLDTSAYEVLTTILPNERK